METQKRHFIIIDDSKLDCFIEEKMVRNTGLSEKITVFQNALNALELIKVRPHPPGLNSLRRLNNCRKTFKKDT
jgi:hypothetical protein